MLDQPITLRSGARLKNRIAKAALTERLADGHHRATPELERLYRRWSNGGAGLLITGNVLVDRYHLEAAGNVVLDADADLDALRRYAAAGTQAGNHLWMQISHAGRQTPAAINPSPKGPSDIALDVKQGAYGTPIAMTSADIKAVVDAYGHAARIAREARFTGVQIHGAHGYLISAFMNPRANIRQDDYGGPLENRARLLLEVVATIQDQAGPDFPLSVKLNSSDFQQGGFTLDDCAQVAKWLEEAGIDLLELSGGNYENPAMIMGKRGDRPAVKEPTRLREAFFIDYAAYLRAHTKLPLMVTGGFRSHAAMVEALEVSAADVIGLGRTLCVEPELPRTLIDQSTTALDVEAGIDPPYAKMPWYYAQLHRLGQGDDPNPTLGGEAAMQEFKDREAASLKAHLAAKPG
ncbi:MAG: NADH:flavin oxidoreductase/NADH oxidase family protein [Pseudomonadota bacterium]